MVMAMVVATVEASSEGMDLWMVVELVTSHEDVTVLSVLSSQKSIPSCIEELVVSRHLIDLEIIWQQSVVLRILCVKVSLSSPGVATH